MAKLFYRYGVMGSSKTASALMLKYNFEERGQNVLLVKSSVDTRDDVNKISSRTGLYAECIPFEELLNQDLINYDLIIVDEVQFLSEQDIDTLIHITDNLCINVVCYGLRTDFQGELFEASKYLFSHADKIEELKSSCWCGRKATHNARLDETKKKVIKTGNKIEIGGNNRYVSLCRKHFKSGKAF